MTATAATEPEDIEAQAIGSLMDALSVSLIGLETLTVASALMNLLHHAATLSSPDGRALIVEKLQEMAAMLESMDLARH